MDVRYCKQKEPEHFRYDLVSLANLNPSMTSVSKEEPLDSGLEAATPRKSEVKPFNSDSESLSSNTKELQSL